MFKNLINEARRAIRKGEDDEDYNPDETTPGEKAVASGIGKAVGAELGPLGSKVGGAVAPHLVSAWKKTTPVGMAYTKIRGMIGK